MKITLNIDMLQRIIDNAKEQIKKDNSLSGIVEINRISESDTHLGSDHVAVWVKSSFQDGQGVLVMNHWK